MFYLPKINRYKTIAIIYIFICHVYFLKCDIPKNINKIINSKIDLLHFLSFVELTNYVKNTKTL